MTIIFFTRSIPNPLANELSRQGHTVHEALSISEVLALAEHNFETHIIIAADVEHDRARMIQRHYPTLHLKPEAALAGIIFELSHFTTGASVQ